jgi:hypothetical protein
MLLGASATFSSIFTVSISLSRSSASPAAWLPISIGSVMSPLNRERMSLVEKSWHKGGRGVILHHVSRAFCCHGVRDEMQKKTQGTDSSRLGELEQGGRNPKDVPT